MRPALKSLAIEYLRRLLSAAEKGEAIAPPISFGPAHAHALDAAQLGYSEEPRAPDCDNTLRQHLWVIVVDAMRTPAGVRQKVGELSLVCAVCRQRGRLAIGDHLVAIRDALGGEIGALREQVAKLQAEPTLPADVVTSARVDELTRSLAHLRERVNALANGDAPKERTLLCSVRHCGNYRTLAPDEPLPVGWTCGVHPPEPAEP